MKIIDIVLSPNWEQKIRNCYFCKTHKSVKYDVTLENGFKFIITVCNKCRALI